MSVILNFVADKLIRINYECEIIFNHFKHMKLLIYNQKPINFHGNLASSKVFYAAVFVPF